jgi:hypothetical protein
MFDPKEIADKADVIIAGFAVVENGKGYSVYDLTMAISRFRPDIKNKKGCPFRTAFNFMLDYYFE